MGEAAILEDVVVKEMVVTKSTGVAGKLEQLQHNMVGATGKEVIRLIVTLFWAVGSDITCCYHRSSFDL